MVLPGPPAPLGTPSCSKGSERRLPAALRVGGSPACSCLRLSEGRRGGGPTPAAAGFAPLPPLQVQLNDEVALVKQGKVAMVVRTDAAAPRLLAARPAAVLAASAGAEGGGHDADSLTDLAPLHSSSSEEISAGLDGGGSGGSVPSDAGRVPGTVSLWGYHIAGSHDVVVCRQAGAWRLGWAGPGCSPCCSALGQPCPLCSAGLGGCTCLRRRPQAGQRLAVRTARKSSSSCPHALAAKYCAPGTPPPTPAATPTATLTATPTATPAAYLPPPLPCLQAVCWT